MNALAQLATSALLGTERRPPEWPATSGPVGALAGRIPREPVELALLHTAGLLGTCHLAGWKPPVASSTIEPAAAEDASKLALPVAINPVLAGIFTDGPIRLQAEAMRKLAEISALIPPKLLPKALEGGKRSVALREQLLPVLGRRGAWLAAQNDAWSFAAGVSDAETSNDQVWEHGSFDQRKLFLAKLREHDPAKARELIKAALGTEGARERTAFIECLTTALGIEDEDLLEASLADKSKEARRVAAQLLMSLPESRFMQRMVTRLQPCLTVEKKFLRGTVITLEPPAAFDSAWKNDLDEAKPKGAPLGDRAWWLMQIVSGVPLPWWEAHTGMTPAELLKWAQKSDWKDSLLKGWAAAQALQRRVEWAEAFLSTELPRGSELNSQDLLDTLPLPLREKHFLRLFSTGEPGQTAAGSAMLDRFLAGIPFDAPPLSADVMKALVQLLKRRIHNGETRYDWQLRASLVELACVIPPSLFDEYASGWDLTKEDVQPFAEAIARLGIVIDQRKQLLLLQPET